MRSISRAGVALVKRFEGFEAEAYQDLAGVWTIGYGHTGARAAPGARVTLPDAEALLLADLSGFAAAVSRAVRVPLRQHQFDALVSLSYNIGVAGFSRSTALARLNAGDQAGAADAITWWNKATIDGRKRTVPGLVRRRAAEAALFLRDDEGPAATPRPCPAEAVPPGRLTLGALLARGTRRGARASQS